MTAQPASDICATLDTFAAAVTNQRRDVWRSCFVEEPVVTFDVLDDDVTIACGDLDDLWNLLGGTTTWETAYTIKSVVVLDGWSAVTRIVTILDDDGGTVWSGVDCFFFDEAGRIVKYQSKDNVIVGVIS